MLNISPPCLSSKSTTFLWPLNTASWGEREMGLSAGRLACECQLAWYLGGGSVLTVLVVDIGALLYQVFYHLQVALVCCKVQR